MNVVSCKKGYLDMYLRLVDMQSYVQVNMVHSHNIAISQKKKKKKKKKSSTSQCYLLLETDDVGC